MQEDYLDAAASLYDFTVEARRWLHRRPELSFHEERTAAYVCEQLAELGVPYKTGFGGHGVVALIEGGQPGRCVALRADMDALPIDEDPAHEVRSQVPGVMHACGHDLHTASLLTVARLLHQHRDQLPGSYLLVFQPAEEAWPGGAKVMLDNGLLDAFAQEGDANQHRPALMLGAHVQPDLPVGHFGFRSGYYMASADEIHLHIHGHGGHGGLPHKLTDTVLTGAEMLVALQAVRAREVPPDTPFVLSFGKFQANGATNVIPNEVYIAGTMRSLNEEVRAHIKTRVLTVCQDVAHMYGATCQVDIRDGYPAVYNDPDLTAEATKLLTQMLGPDNIHLLPLRTTAEDFGYYSHRLPALFYRFGVARPNGATADVHTPQFDPDETALRSAPAIMATLATHFAGTMTKN